MKEMKSVIELYRLAQELEQAKFHQNYSLALELYNRIIQLKGEISNRFGIAKSIAEKANLLELLGNKHQALQEYLHASQIIQNTNNHDFSKIIWEKIASLEQNI